MFPFRRPIKIRLEIEVSTTAEAQAIVDSINAGAQAFADQQAKASAVTQPLQDQIDAMTKELAQEKQDHSDDLELIRAAEAARDSAVAQAAQVLASASV